MTVCPWWAGFLIDNPLRRLIHVPEDIIAPYVQPAMSCLDVGCGMGFFCIPMAKRVGPEGRVIAVDVQQRMLDHLMRRARKAGVAERIAPHLCAPDDIGIHGPVDFAGAFFSIHETPDAFQTIGQICRNLKPGGLFMIVEPVGEVSPQQFETTLALGEKAGLQLHARFKVRFARAAVLKRA